MLPSDVEYGNSMMNKYMIFLDTYLKKPKEITHNIILFPYCTLTMLCIENKFNIAK